MDICAVYLRSGHNFFYVNFLFWRDIKINFE